MSSQALSENHLAHDEVSEVLENGGILRDSPILTLEPAPDRAPSTAQELFDAVHAVVDVSWSSADALRDAVRQAIGLPPAEKPRAPALDRYSFQHGELYGEDVRLEDENGEPTDQWACASIPGYVIYDRLASDYVAFAYDAALAEKIVAFLNAETR